jgi:acyl dehydratase
MLPHESIAGHPIRSDHCLGAQPAGAGARAIPRQRGNEGDRFCLNDRRPVKQLPAISLGGLLVGALRSRRGAAGHQASQSCYRLAAFDLAQLDAYRSLLGFAPEALPLTCYYLIAQRAHLATMTGPAFPFRLAGMIHVANAITEFAPPRLDGEFVVRDGLRVEPRTESGAQYCVFETMVEQAGQPVFRCESRYLAVRGERQARLRLALDGALGEPVGAWRLAEDEGRRYAQVSGDWNPIHLWRWSARLFGLQQPIVHGMHTIAKACALLERAGGRRIASIGARFVAPVPLGSEARLEADWAGGRYFVIVADRLAVEGGFSTSAMIDVL